MGQLVTKSKRYPATTKNATESRGVSATTHAQGNQLAIPMLNSIAIRVDEIEIDDEDQISRAAKDVCIQVLSYLSLRDLCHVQQVSQFWYEMARENELWKIVTLLQARRENWYTLPEIQKKQNKDNIKWKRIARDHYQPRLCVNCGKVYRRCYNKPTSCMVS